MKKVLIFTSLMLIFGLSTLSFAQTQIESGKWSIVSSNANYTLDKNEGDRSMIIDINFDEPFERKPDVIISVTLFDGIQGSSVKYNVSPISVSRDGFLIKVATWSNARISGIGGYWIAHAKAK